MDTKEKDVKQDKDESSTSTAAKDSVDTDKKEESKEMSFEDATGESAKTIPYAVFKERNDALRDTQRKLKKLESDIETKIQDAVYRTAQQHKDYYEQKLAEVQQMQQADVYSDENTAKYEHVIAELKKEIGSLKSEFGSYKERSSEDLLKRQISDLRSVYPNLDVQHVLAMKKYNPGKDLDECAEDSHNYFTNHAKSIFDRMVEQKKQAAKKVVTGTERAFSMKPSERPKTLKEAKQKLMEHFASED